MVAQPALGPGWIGIVLFAGQATAMAILEDGDDFSNNLFSDLAPLLALFGERVTLQFLSQSTTLADCIIFAMAPLGIVTAIVSAIRVAGPGWLKAIVGRARENLVAAEIELMSSTSHETCELWNGRNVVRCPGRGSIREFICIRAKGDGQHKPSGIRIMRLNFAIANRFLEKEGEEKSNADGSKDLGSWWRSCGALLRWWTPGGRRVDTGNVDEEQATGVAVENNGHDPELPGESEASSSDEELSPDELIIIHNANHEAPNLSLNSGGETGLFQLWFIALFGTVLQLGVLVYFALLTYHPALRLEKDGKPVENYAFPLAGGGTVLLVLGMLVCAHVIEASTEEQRFVVCPHQQAEARTIWLQSSNTVSEQRFESLAVWPSRQPATITTSKRIALQEYPQSSPSKPSLVDTPDIPSCHLHPQSATTTATARAESLRSTGTTTYPSLRRRHAAGPGSAQRPHSAASASDKAPVAPVRTTLSQKVIGTQTVIGTAISLVGFIVQFTGLRGMHWTASVTQLAAILLMSALRAYIRRNLGTRLQDRPLENDHELDWFACSVVGSGRDPWLSGNRKTDSFGGWELVTDEEPPARIRSDAESESASERESESSDTEESDAQTLLWVRTSLARMVGWKSEAAADAVCLARAIEVALGSLLGVPREDGPWNHYWSVKVFRQGCVEPETLRFDAYWLGGSWRADAGALEAAISLWLYHVKLRDRSPGAEQADERSILPNDDGWLRDKGPRLDVGLKLLGPTGGYLTRDFAWWMPGGQGMMMKARGQRAALADSLEENFYKIPWTRVALGGWFRPANDEVPFNPPTPPRIVDDGETPDPYPIVESARARRATNDGYTPRWLLSRLDSRSGPRMGKYSVAALSHATRGRLYAQDLFSAFLWRLMLTTDAGFGDAQGTLTSRGSKRDTWLDMSNDFSLHNDKLSKLAQDIATTGLGTVEDAFHCLIPPLSGNGRLPGADAVMDRMCAEAVKYEKRGTLAGAGDLYRDLLPENISYDASSPQRRWFYRQTVARLLAYQARLEVHRFLAARGNYADQNLEHEIGVTNSYLKSMDSEVVAELSHFMKMKFDGQKKLLDDEEQPETADTLKDRGPGKDFDLKESFKALLPLRNLSGFTRATDIFGMTPLHYATIVADMEPEGTEQLVTDGALGNTRFSRYRTTIAKLPFQDAEVARELYGWTEHHSLALLEPSDLENGPDASYERLLRQGQDPNAKDVSGWTPLHHLSMSGLPVLVALGRLIKLVDKGADVNAREIGGATPLHYAAWGNNLALVDGLLRAGADPTVMDNSRRTALRYAEYQGAASVTEYLSRPGRLHPQ